MKALVVSKWVEGSQWAGCMLLRSRDCRSSDLSLLFHSMFWLFFVQRQQLSCAAMRLSAFLPYFFFRLTE